MRKNSTQFYLLFFMCLLLQNSFAQQTARTGFVNRKDTMFNLDSKPFYFSGTNNYYMMYKPSSMAVDIINTCAESNLKVIRIWGFMDGSTKHDGNCIQTAARVYDESGLRKIDTVVYLAKQKGIRLLISMVNYWPDFGGMDVYTGWAGSGSRESFYTNTAAKSIYKDYLKMWVNRVNHITGVKYIDESSVFAWELTNEARSSDATGATITNWTREMSDYLRSIDPYHMIALGDEGGYCLPYNSGYDGGEYTGGHGVHFPSIVALPNIDFGTVHNYAEDWWGKNLTWSNEWVRKHIADAHALNKPVILEEYSRKITPYTPDKDIIRYTTMKPQADLVEKMGAAGSFSWMLSGINTADPSPGKPMYRDTWDDGFQFTKNDPIIDTFLVNHATRMWNKNFITPPSAFNQVSPANLATNLSVSTVFNWNAAPSAANYNLVVSTNSNFSSPILSKNGILVNSFKITSPLAFSTQYYWKVTAVNIKGQTIASNSGISFTTQAKPPVPSSFSQVSPINVVDVAISNTSFSWGASSNVDSYSLSILLGTDTIYNAIDLTTTSHICTKQLSYGSNYTWSVTALNTSGKTKAANSGATFKTVLPPSKIDNFESYASDAALSASWVRNASGQIANLSLNTAQVTEGTKAMKLTYDFTSYCGVSKAIAANFVGYAGLSYSLFPNASGKDLTIQIKESSLEYWEATIQITGSSLTEIYIPFSSFKKPSWNSTGNSIVDLGSIVEVSFYLGGTGGAGEITIDNLRLSNNTATVSVTGVSISPSTITLATVGQTQQLTPTVAPSNASNKTVSYSTSNASVASVNASGLITAVANGSAVITVTTQDGAKTAIANVTVNAPILVSSVSISPSTVSLTAIGQTQQLTPTVAPSNASNKTVSYTTSNASVASVSASGLITAIATGSAVITVTTQSGAKTATANVTVSITIPVTGVSISPSTISLTAVGQTQQLTPTVAPSNASNKTVSYTTSNASVASVSASGLIAAVANGSAIITVTTQSGAKTATSNVTVAIQNTSKIYEAENAVLSGVVVATSIAGYSGTGYVDGFDGTNDKVTFNVTTTTAGQYTLVTRYTSPFEVKYNTLVVNGVNLGDKTFNQSSTFVETNLGSINLNAGANTIEIVKSWGWIMIDYIKLTGAIGLKNETITTYATSSLNVFPNPSNGIFIVSDVDLIGSEISVFSQIGVLIYSTVATSNEVEINLNSKFSGLGILKIKKANETITQKVIIK